MCVFYDLWQQRVAFQLLAKERCMLLCSVSCASLPLSLSGSRIPYLIKFLVIYTFFGELKWIKNRILLSFITGPKIQAHGHFLTYHMHTYLFWSLNIFLLISFWAEFSRMFLFCVFSWLVEKYKTVTSMLMRLWSEISRKFLSMFWGLIILRQKKCLFYILFKLYQKAL